MNRRLILSVFGLSPLILAASKVPTMDNPIVEDLINRWEKSKEYTLAVLDAMPAEHLEFRPSEVQMSFAQHFMHLGYTNNVFIGILRDSKTYPDFDALMQADFFLDRPDPINLYQPDYLTKREPQTNKKLVADYLTETFDYVISSVGKITDEDLKKGRDKVKPWFLEGHTNLDLILRGESHTAHHRAQAICYLRMKEIRPPGYSKYNTL